MKWFGKKQSVDNDIRKTRKIMKLVAKGGVIYAKDVKAISRDWIRARLVKFLDKIGVYKYEVSHGKYKIDDWS